ncbi:TRAP transporter large permease [Spiribacter halobius]|uniref:TRAP transporter large permease protein n=1 Tax=Sediminicurvatus halobius TaxID=2182432 RepID=A0A2U2N633_9GAMM|nr:TRAP transporter large permease [Spiribacter halobius]PWG64532.1 C4-dicarboxylate ABC transporter [Spiribacter halobius]UEX79145.1 TRAP transporter large permease [Spiribacter halobius]
MDVANSVSVGLGLGWAFYLPLAALVGLLVLGVPIWVSIGLGTVGMLYFGDGLPLSLFGEALFDGISAFALLAIPMFVLTGDLLVRTGLSDRLLDLAEATVGPIRTGMGTATVLGCGFFACVSGSDAAGAAAVGRMTVHRLVEVGYPRPAAAALVAAGACTGILIPPSIAYIIIGLVLGISVSTLFLAALVPGVLILISIMITNAVLNRIHGYERADKRFALGHWLRTVWAARYALMVPVVILGGIYSGIFTPTEAAAVAVMTTASVGFMQGTLSLADVPKTLESSARINGVIVPIIALSLPLAQTLSSLDIPEYFVSAVVETTENPYLVALLIIGILVAAGCVMEATPNIVILSPLLLPLAESIGMHEIHFAVVMITALGVGFITPPLGLNLFVLAGISGESIFRIAARAVPFVLVMLAVVILLAFVPALSMWSVS